MGTALQQISIQSVLYIFTKRPDANLVCVQAFDPGLNDLWPYCPVICSLVEHKVCWGSIANFALQ
jgi:hypothetical protein